MSQMMRMVCRTKASHSVPTNPLPTIAEVNLSVSESKFKGN